MRKILITSYSTLWPHVTVAEVIFCLKIIKIKVDKRVKSNIT